jgi:hypothetical protein
MGIYSVQLVTETRSILLAASGGLFSFLVFRLIPKSLSFGYFFTLWIAILALHVALCLLLSIKRDVGLRLDPIAGLRKSLLFSNATYCLLVGFMCYYFDLPKNGRLVSPEIHTGFGGLVFLCLIVLAILFIVMGFRYRVGTKPQNR